MQKKISCFTTTDCQRVAIYIALEYYAIKEGKNLLMYSSALLLEKDKITICSSWQNGLSAFLSNNEIVEILSTAWQRNYEQETEKSHAFLSVIAVVNGQFAYFTVLSHRNTTAWILLRSIQWDLLSTEHSIAS